MILIGFVTSLQINQLENENIEWFLSCPQKFMKNGINTTFRETL